MYRFLLYLLVPLAYASAWAILLMGNYDVYLSNSPEMLSGYYLKAFAGNRNLLLFSELLFPAVMTLFFIILLIVKLRLRPIRLPVLIAQFLSLEFFIYRQFSFTDSYAQYHLQQRMETPIEYLETISFILPLAFSAFFFVVLLFFKEELPKPDLFTSLVAEKEKKGFRF